MDQMVDEKQGHFHKYSFEGTSGQQVEQFVSSWRFCISSILNFFEKE
jgi:hypothetical protein